MRAVCVLAAVLGISAAALAQEYTLKQGQAEVKLNIGPTGASPSGVFWLQRNQAGGFDQVQDAVQQTLFYRTGSMTKEVDVNTLPALVTPVNLDADADFERLDVTYQGTGFNIIAQYRVPVGGNGLFRTTLNRSVSVVNTGSSAIDFHLYEYSDYNLTGWIKNAGGGWDPNTQVTDDVLFVSANGDLLQQTSRDKSNKGVVSVALVSSTGNPTHNNGYPDRYEVGKADDPNSILQRLTDDLPTNLANNIAANPSGDVVYAFQYDIMSLAAGDSFVVNGAMAITPEPGSIALLAGGLSLVFGWRRRARKA